MGITTRKTIAERSSDKPFMIAKIIADAACELDFLRKVADRAAAAEAEKHINILHGCAAALAGNRVSEIYEQVDGLVTSPLGRMASGR